MTAIDRSSEGRRRWSTRISGEVAFGWPVSLSLDIALPVARSAVIAGKVEARPSWTVREFSDRVVDADGSRRYRLRFARDYTDTFRVRIRYRLPFVEQPATDHEGTLGLAPIRVLDGVSTGVYRMLIAAEPGIEVKTECKGWSRAGQFGRSRSARVRRAEPPIRPRPDSDRGERPGRSGSADCSASVRSWPYRAWSSPGSGSRRPSR